LSLLDLSEIYLELNLSVDAREMAEQAHARFNDLGMGYEAAKALSNAATSHGQEARRSRPWRSRATKGAARRRDAARHRPQRYNGFMITRGIRELVARDWEAVRENKEIYWGERIGRLGATEGLRVAEELRRQMLRRNPGWPDAETREADLHFHASLAERFRRAGATRRG
jgi:hypothetical protein